MAEQPRHCLHFLAIIVALLGWYLPYQPANAE